jgi:hypothetical protein
LWWSRGYLSLIFAWLCPPSFSLQQLILGRSWYTHTENYFIFTFLRRIVLLLRVNSLF